MYDYYHLFYKYLKDINEAIGGVARNDVRGGFSNGMFE